MTKTAPTLPVSALAAQIDELGALERELAPWKNKISRVEDLRKAIRLAHDASPPNAEIVVTGSRYIAILSPRGLATVIDFKRLVRIIKPTGFAKFAQCTLADLSANVTGGIYETVTSKEQIGPRGLKTFEKAKA